ncbi:hypothetical protein [Paenibacillus vortex]|nr:hypothetical protein [Paenibacillus vortex]
MNIKSKIKKAFLLTPLLLIFSAQSVMGSPLTDSPSSDALSAKQALS